MNEMLNVIEGVSCFGNVDLSVEYFKKNGGYLLMDVDGCLIEGGLETVGNKKTLDVWSQENQENIELFRQNIMTFEAMGFKVGLSTGRGLEFSKRLIDCIFPKENGIFLDKSIVEGGLIIYDNKTGIGQVSSNVDEKGIALLKTNRDRIINLGTKCGAEIEKGKSLGISFNPPIDEDGIRNTDSFRDLLLKEIDPNLVENLVITNSSTAVDITPKGVDKMTTMENLVGNRGVIYLGDGKNDETSMQNSKVKINLSPSNSHEVIKKLVSSGQKPGLISSEPELEGVNQMLGFLMEKIRKLWLN